jgi:glyoxylase-like metal-dependent hydrolase (beta-lactamase superfamily II)
MRTVVPEQIAEGVWVVALGRRPLGSNVYLVRSGASWVLIDTGWPGNGRAIRQAAEVVFGRGVSPTAILVTHLHIDHSESLMDLVAAWDGQAFVHPRELPLAGGYVPEFANPMDRRVVLPVLDVLPRRFRKRVLSDDRLPAVVRALDPDAPPPGLPDWSCVSVPGHTPGSVAFYRPRDGLLITGDALLTVDLTTLRCLVLGRTELAAPLGFTHWDRTVAEHSIGALAALAPRTIAPGHGRPLGGPRVPYELRAFADRTLAAREATSP